MIYAIKILLLLDGGCRGVSKAGFYVYNFMEKGGRVH
jgi:hypothetical protein